jgi:hypothetical protein
MGIAVVGALLSFGACGDDGGGTDTTGGDTLVADTSGDAVDDTAAADSLITDSSVTDSLVGDTGGDTLTGDTSVTDTSQPPPTGCEDPIPTPASGVCSVTAGSTDALLIRGDIVMPTGIQERGSVLIVNGFITCSGCDCPTEAAAQGATVIACPHGVIAPGFINAHDHITYTQMSPVAHGTTRYNHRHEWRTGANGKPKLSSKSNTNSLGDAWGEARQVMGGATSLFGSGSERGFLRNLDKPNALERISHLDATYDTFPLGDSGGTIVSSGCSNYNLPGVGETQGTAAYAPHVAEGVIGGARNEYVCMSGQDSGGVDVLGENSAYIHSVGLTSADIALMAGEGGSLIWSPRSNTDLYGFTASAPIFDRLGARIALGTDWTASGSVTMGRELRCAEEWNVYWNNYFSDKQLVDMATYGAADALGFGDIIGSLTAGKAADITIWDGTTNTGYRAILDGNVDDVLLVLRGGTPLTYGGNTYFRRGTPLYGEPALVDALSDRPLDWSKYDHVLWPSAASLPAPCEEVDVCGATKKLCVAEQLETTVSGGSALTTTSLAQFRADLEPTSYGLFFCDTPTNEPSCVPARPGEFTGAMVAGDMDGDGVADADDDCPSYFNPPRPMDGTSQPDVDGDGVGDVCDPCPFDANTTACTSVDPDDIDGDGYLNPNDNCPAIPNEDQADGDEDGVGDLCDKCPEDPNPNGAPCPASIYDVKKRVTAIGDAVSIKGVVVTALASNAYTVQLPASDLKYDGAAYSALYVFNGSDPKPAIGDKVDVSGVVSDYFGEVELTSSSWTIVTSGVGAPAPLVVTPAEVAVGGANADAYEALLVKVQNVSVLNIAPTGQTGETVAGEFLVTGDLSVDDQIFLVSPFPVVGQTYTAITGVLRFTWNRNKLLPRSAADFVEGTPILLAAEPAQSWIYQGQSSAMTTPPLNVVLTGEALAAMTVGVTSGNTSALTVVGGGVNFVIGDRTKPVLLNALAANADVTLTATLDDVTVTAHVTVLAAAHVPTPASVVPASSVVTHGDAATFTVTLDTPAPPAGLTVGLAATGPHTTVPASLAFAAGEMVKTVDVGTPSDGVGTLTLTATTSAGSANGSVEVSDAPPRATVIWCFENAAGTFITTPTVDQDSLAASTFVYGSGVANQANVSGNSASTVRPAECTAATSKAATGTGWPTGTARGENNYYGFILDVGPGVYHLSFEVLRSGTGPTSFEVVSTVDGMLKSWTIGDVSTWSVFDQDVTLTGGPDQIRFYAYASEGTAGTLRIDNFALRPAN